MEEVQAVVLAAGLGTRMGSPRPKVLHELAGRPLIAYVLDALRGAGLARPIVVVGHGAGEVRAAVGPEARFVRQPRQLGTGHAVLQAAPLLRAHPGTVLVVYGDTPFLRAATLRGLLAHHAAQDAGATILTATLDDPTGYGRVVRDADGAVARLVEEADASSDERRIREINAGVYAFRGPLLLDALGRLAPANAQGEYYLTDTIEELLRRGARVAAFVTDDPDEAIGVNSREQLAAAEARMRRRALPA